MNEVRKNSIREYKELKAIGISLLFLLLGFAIVWFVKTIVKIEDNAVYVSLLFIPVLVYVIISGRLKELKGPGGLEARFSEAAAQEIKPVSETIEPSVEEMQVVAKEGLRVLQRKKPDIDETRPIIMTMVPGKGRYYDWNAVAQYVSFLGQYRNFKFVVFLDDKEHFVAYMPSWAFKGLISLPELAGEFISVVNEGRMQDLCRYPGVVKETISTKSSNVEALRRMTAENLEALVVIDEDRKLKGVIEREQVISKIMLTLVK
jgi:CBS domain-containing protein